MRKYNYFILLELSFDPVETNEELINKAIYKKQKEWSRLLINPKKKNEAQIYLEKIKDIKDVLLDPKKRVLEAEEAKEIRRKKYNELKDIIRLKEDKGYIEQDELKQLSIKYLKYRILEEDIKNIVTKPILINNKCDQEDKVFEFIDKTTANAIENSLNVLGDRHKSLYGFLAINSNTDLEKVKEVISEKNKNIMSIAKKTGEINAQEELLGLALKIFKTKEDKQKYDNYIQVTKYTLLNNYIKESVVLTEGNGRKITESTLINLINLSIEKYNISFERSLEYIWGNCKFNEIEIENILNCALFKTGNATVCSTCNIKEQCNLYSKKVNKITSDTISNINNISNNKPSNKSRNTSMIAVLTTVITILVIILIFIFLVVFGSLYYETPQDNTIENSSQEKVASNDDSINKQLSEAEELIKDNKYQEASIILEGIIASNENNTSAISLQNRISEIQSSNEVKRVIDTSKYNFIKEGIIKIDGKDCYLFNVSSKDGTASVWEEYDLCVDKETYDLYVISKSGNIKTFSEFNSQNLNNTTSKDVDYSNYYNSRYGYSIKYPSDFKLSTSTNKDGVSYKNSDGTVEFRIWGANNINNYTLEESYQIATSAHSNITYKDIVEDHYVISYTENGFIWYECEVVGDGSTNTFQIKYPADQANYYSKIVNKLYESFTSGDTSIGH